jgi:hypothetical protein
VVADGKDGPAFSGGRGDTRHRIRGAEPLLRSVSVNLAELRRALGAGGFLIGGGRGVGHCVGV